MVLFMKRLSVAYKNHFILICEKVFQITEVHFLLYYSVQKAYVYLNVKIILEYNLSERVFLKI